MKKSIILVLVGILVQTTLFAQSMSKEETLNYIQRIYSRTNCFYLKYVCTSCQHINFPVGIDRVELEFDQLVIYYNVPGDYHAYSGPRSATISGELILDEEKDCINNSEGDWVLATREGNSAELKKLYFAIKNLQLYIKEDPYAQNVNQYGIEKKQREAEERRLQGENQRNYYAQRQREEEQRRHAEELRQEQTRRNQERKGQESIREAQNRANQDMYGGGNRQWTPGGW
jgi:hypothetical protein